MMNSDDGAGTTAPRGFWSVMGRALRARCPNCGKGRLFASYLKQVDQCAACNEQWGNIRADDGPAWLTIMVVGHILAPIMLLVIPESNWPDWVSALVWSSLALVLTLAFLPSAKGVVMAMIWRMRAAQATSNK